MAERRRDPPGAKRGSRFGRHLQPHRTLHPPPLEVPRPPFGEPPRAAALSRAQAPFGRHWLWRTSSRWHSFAVSRPLWAGTAAAPEQSPPVPPARVPVLPCPRVKCQGEHKPRRQGPGRTPRPQGRAPPETPEEPSFARPSCVIAPIGPHLGAQSELGQGALFRDQRNGRSHPRLTCRAASLGVPAVTSSDLTGRRSRLACERSSWPSGGRNSVRLDRTAPDVTGRERK